MASRTRPLLLLLVLSACGGGGGGGDTGSGGPSTGPGSSGPGSSGPGSSGPTTGAASETASTTGAATSGGITGSASEAPTSGGPGTSGEPGTSGSSSSGEGSSGTTGGPPAACVDVSGDYGPCEALLGYGFDGTSCRLFSGCICAPHCDDFAPDPLGCALGCAAAGACNPGAMQPAGINQDPVMQGSFCDELDACTDDPEAVAWLKQIFAMVECEPAGFPCAGQNCHLLWQGALDAAQWDQACAASLLPAADLRCVIWGP